MNHLKITKRLQKEPKELLPHSLTHSFNKYLSSAYHVQAIEQGRKKSMINKIWSLFWSSLQRRVTNRLTEFKVFKVPKWEVLWQTENATGGQGSRDSLPFSLGQVSPTADSWIQLVGIWQGERQRTGQNGFLIFWPNMRRDGRGMTTFFIQREFKAAQANAKPRASCSHKHKDNLSCGSSWAPSSNLQSCGKVSG